ncbi:MAG: DivIVA domain-containing protein [Oscillospiraceae bacterium]|nr:DivIVA domain-containing protein [Oscillospiraceae bacterium]
MITPQEIEQISFNRATFGGYDMQAVDEFLEPLIEDYITLYKENGLLKSKMKVLVSKLEEYRANEASMKDAIVNAQKTCDKMVKEAEAKCTQMLIDANAAAAENAKNADALIAAENDRVEEARQAAHLKIEELQSQLQSCVQALDRIKEANRPIHKPSGAFDYDRSEGNVPGAADAVADEISANLEALVGTTEDAAPKAEPRHPASDTTTKYANLRFGKNYDPTNR